MCACTVQTHLDAAGITLATSRDLTRVVLLRTDAFFFSFSILQQPLSELPLSILTSLWTVETSKIATVGRLPLVGLATSSSRVNAVLAKRICLGMNPMENHKEALPHDSEPAVRYVIDRAYCTNSYTVERNQCNHCLAGFQTLTERLIRFNHSRVHTIIALTIRINKKYDPQQTANKLKSKTPFQ